MHAHLELLLQLQDLKSQVRELAEGEPDRLVEEQEFHIDIEQAVSQLQERIGELSLELPPAVRGRLDRFSRGSGRAVVPVINGTCYGCFSALPTASTSTMRNDRLNVCEQCGRFLYVLPD
jgi:predicted  nucleic acid-binding Zn-ribbon protein